MSKPLFPGIHVETGRSAEGDFRLDTSCLAGFVGIAERGPLHEPVSVDSWEAYRETFGGFNTPGRLPLSVYSFFLCGGSRCVIVRAANEHAACRARLSLACFGGGSLVLEASSPGVWGNHITARVWHSSPPEKKAAAAKRKPRSNRTDAGDSFSLTLSCKKQTETYLDLSPDSGSPRYYLPYINSRSRLCRARAAESAGIPRPCFLQTAAGGADGIADMLPADFTGWYKGPGLYRGLGALETRGDISLIASPDLAWLMEQPGKSKQEKEAVFFAAQAALTDQAERFPGRFAVLDAPPRAGAAEAALWARKFGTAAAALYYPEIDVRDPENQSGAGTLRIPPSGAVCGCIAATDTGKGIFHAPANITVAGAVGASSRPGIHEEEFLFAAGVNLLKYFPGRGVKIWGGRTLSADSAWRYINVRRTFSRVAASIQKGTRWAVFESNTKDLRKRLTRQAASFLLDLWRKGFLAGATPEQAFFVRCDEELNPPENTEKGILTFEAGISITRPAEFFRISITAEKDGARVLFKEE